MRTNLLGFKNTKVLFSVLCLMYLFGCIDLYAQAPPVSPNNSNKKDTSANKSNTNQWKNEDAKISYELLNSNQKFLPDSGIHDFQRNKFTQPWYQDMGNLGSPAYNMLFTPEQRFGPSLGYHSMDAYRYNIDSLKYYNTNRPYSVFGYILGSKLEQVANIMHSQNIRPNWNVTVEYRKLTSPGYYKIQRNNHDNLYLSSVYKSLDKHYQLNFGMVYNKEQHDENGGLSNTREFDSVDVNGNKIYDDRKTFDAVTQNDYYSITRAPVYNIQREFTILLRQSYTLGKTDTTYNKDTTQYSFQLKPKFKIIHQFELSSEKHTYKDLTPDSMRYVSLFNHAFGNAGWYSAGQDSVFSEQKWFWVDNKILLGGFAGGKGKEFLMTAGLGTRFDRMIFSPVSNLIQDSLPNKIYTTGTSKFENVNNYLEANIQKDLHDSGKWAYKGNFKYFLTGPCAGNYSFSSLVLKDFTKGVILFGYNSVINSVPYCYSYYQNLYIKDTFNLTKETVNTFFATLVLKKPKVSIGVRNYIINNYLYIGINEVPTQYTAAFSITQIWLRKVFKIGNFYFDNEIVYQQTPQNAPVNLPLIMDKHQLTYERAFYDRKLKIAIGIDIHYYTSYRCAGYNYLLNSFAYQNNVTISNLPETSVFLNFRIKNRFRAFVMADQLQQSVGTMKNNFVFSGIPTPSSDNPGYMNTPMYALQNTILRLGFSWVLIN